MRIGWKLAWANLLALALNALFLFVAVWKQWPAIVPITYIVGSLAALVWLSCKLNGKL